MRNLLFVILLLSTSLTVLAQSNQNRIIDLDGSGVAGVEIIGRGNCAGFTSTKNTFTDTNGRFSWPDPGPPPFPAPRGCVETTVYSWELRKEGYSFTRTFFLLGCGNIGLPDLIHATTLPTVPNVSAASFASQGIVAREMIVSLFGTRLAPATAIAEGALPTTLAGRKVLVKDVTGMQKAAKLFFVSPTQINYLMPEGLADGPAQVRVVDGNDNLINVGLVEIRTTVPGIFTDNANGKGVPSALVVRVRPGNVQTYEPVSRFDQATGQYVPLELDLGPESEFLVLALFGTGWRRTPGTQTVSVIIGNEGTGGVNCPVEYIGTQPTFEGLDQINVRLPRALAGKGEVVVIVSIGCIRLNDTILKFK